MKGLCSVGMLIGRLCLSAIFIAAAIGKVMDYNGTAQYMASKGMTLIPLFYIGAILIEFLAGLSLLIGFKARIAATILLLFLIPTTLIFHDFWNIDEAMARQLEMIMFMKNLAIFGGLLYVVCTGAGHCAISGRHCQS